MGKNAVSSLVLSPDAPLGERVKYYRCLRGYSQENLAFDCGTSTSRIREIEKGRCNPRMSTVNKIAEALEVSPDALLRETDAFILEAQQCEFLDNIQRMIAAYQASCESVKKMMDTQCCIMADSYEEMAGRGEA